MDWITPETLKTGGNLIVILVMLYGAYKLLNKIIEDVVKPMAGMWTKTVSVIGEALAVITVQLGQLHEDHKEITENLTKLNGK